VARSVASAVALAPPRWGDRVPAWAHAQLACPARVLATLAVGSRAHAADVAPPRLEGVCARP
jgi:hypothetical protein